MTNPSSLPPPSNRYKLNKLMDRIRLSRLWEMWYPLLGGVAVAATVYAASVNKESFDKLLKDVVPAALSIAAIFAGFQGAIHAILLTLLRTRIVRAMRKTDSYKLLISYVGAGFATLMLFVSCSLSVLAITAFDLYPEKLVRSGAAVLIGLFAWSLLASVRITVLEVKLLNHPDEI